MRKNANYTERYGVFHTVEYFLTVNIPFTRTREVVIGQSCIIRVWYLSPTILSNSDTVIFSLRTRPEYHAPSCSPNIIGLARLFEHVDRDEPTQTVHICLALAVTFCPTIDGMSHPQQRTAAWCLYPHGLFTRSCVNARFPRRFAETSQSECFPETDDSL